MADILYLTQDGITDHIGQAQIAPYLLGLAARGHSIHLVSAEKPGRKELKQKYQSLFDQAGIEWSTVRYRNFPPLISSAWVLLRMHLLAHRVMRRQRQPIIHCRTYLPLELALRLKRTFGAKLIVDFRDFWADVGIEEKPFKFVYRFLKRREPRYAAAADHFVTLTDKAADILVDWYPQAAGGRRSNYTVIPCCADFDFFDRKRLAAGQLDDRRRELALNDGPVLVYLGSLGHDYLLGRMLDLFGALLDRKPDATFLFITNNQPHAIVDEARRRAIPIESLRTVSVDRAEVPSYAALADLSVIFIRPTLSKAGCSPTKLAELFALDIPVIANSGVGDLDEILEFERNGSVIVKDFEPASLRAALDKILDAPPKPYGAIREAGRVFSLEHGVARYHAIYETLARASASGPGSQAASC